MRCNRHSAVTLVSFLALLLIVLSASDASALPKASSIELADGTVYHDVQYRVDKLYYIVVISAPDDDVNISFTEIVAIIDEDGEDVTVEKLGGDYRPARKAVSKTPESTPAAPVEQPVAGTPEVAQPTEAWPTNTSKPVGRTSPFNIGVQVNVGYSFPLGSWYDGINSGVGYGADVFIRLTHEMALRGTISKAGARREKQNYYDGLPIIRNDVDISVMRYYLSLQYYNWNNWRRNGKLMWYLYSGLGAVSHSSSGMMIVHDPYENTDYIIIPEGDTITKFSLVNGGGFTQLLGERTAIQFGCTWDLLFIGKVEDDDSYSGLYGDVQTASILEIQVGIVQFF